MENRSKQNKTLLIILGSAGIFVMLCGLIALGLLYQWGRPYFGPRMQVILEPDYSRISTVDPADLERTAMVLNERCRALGRGISFVVAENNQIIARAPDTVNPESVLRSAITIGLLEIVDFGETPIPSGTAIKTDIAYKYFPEAEGTEWHTIISNSDFESAYVTRDQVGGFQVSFTLTSSSTKTFADYTTKNIGHYLGIVLDKIVVSAPRLNAPITDGRGIIAGSFTQETAESLAVYLNTTGPLPIPLKIKQVIKN